MKISKENLVKIKENVWEIPKTFRKMMKVPARIYASEKLLSKIWEDQSLEQLVNTTTLPGVVGYTLAMPDMHEGYGCPIGGVIATRLPDGVISPGAIGYDINCGTRILLSDIKYDRIKNNSQYITEAFFRKIPLGVGSTSQIKLTDQELKEVLETGLQWTLRKKYASKNDIVNCEEQGQMKSARADKISGRAKHRGHNQLGTLGSGNHFLEIQRVDTIYDREIAKQWGIYQDQITIQIHTGSRGLGHQNCQDFVRVMRNAVIKYNIKLPDPELVCAPFNSTEGKNYYQSMSAAANFAWVNRQMLTYFSRQIWKNLGYGDLKLLYDVAHNIAKTEDYIVPDTNQKAKICVHRKGATRAFLDQPVLIPGSMGTASYILMGRETAIKETFGTVCHGAGRIMSRGAAKRQIWGQKLVNQLRHKNITVRSNSMSGLAEEAPIAYKDIDEVVRVVHDTGLATRVARLIPIGVIKG